MRTKKSLQGTQHTNCTKSPSRKKGHSSDVHKNFFRSYVPTNTKNTTTSLVIHSKERMHIVDSGASLHMMGLTSPSHNEKKTVKQDSGYSDPNGIVVSDTQAKVYIKDHGACLRVHLVEVSPSVLSLGRELGYS